MAKNQDFEKDFVKLKNVSKIYRMGEVEIRAVDKIEFAIDKGEFVVVVGPSGAGKTTVLNILGGMDTVTSGDVLVDGENIAKYSQRKLTGYRRDDIGFVFQFYNLVQNLTALENVEIGLEAAGIPSAARRARALDMLTLTGLSGRENQIPAELSGGQKQRLCIARALLKKPKILILDDSTSAVDTKTDALIRKAFREEIPDTTKIIIAQRISSVEDADLILVLDDGKINGMGTHEELLAHNEIYREVYESQQKGGLEE